ncbi:MAG: 2Fe-2S iron-sulfur cluster-binding protein, partial [Gammaproteobacteria bacterium]|nr:2Fe-2S iron-sulfur cluster-binding protein [Gammaproteobacteria bacterium]
MKKQINRLEHDARLNRRKSIRFWFDNRAYEGYEGDTLASALLANGVHLVGRSFKYHRPRGIYTAGSEEPNALVQLEEKAYTEPNRRATEIEIYEGLIAHSQNCWPSCKLDIGIVNSWFSRILPAGFYYKTFMWPASFWMIYEKYIRKAAGLGRSPAEPDPHFYDKTYAHCDVLVIGGGPAGIQAAIAAGQTGCRVILADEKSEFGGMLLSENMLINGMPCHEWIESKTAELKTMSNIVLLNRTTVTGYYDYNFLVANQRVSEHLGPRVSVNSPKERLWKIRARQVVMATGAIERPLVFGDNDRPGIMLASAIRTYINRYSTLPGKNCVILTNNDSAYHAALDIADEGGQVSIIDVRTNPAGAMADSAASRGIRILANSTVAGVGYSRGRLRYLEAMELSDDGLEAVGKKQKLPCDLVGISGGWNPTIHLFSQSRGKLKFNENHHCFLAGRPSQDNPVILAGSCQATWFSRECMEEGHAAGCEAAKRAGFSADQQFDGVKTGQLEYSPQRPLWILPGGHPIGQGKTKHFHELHNDATIGDIHLAVREGYESVEHLKRYTTTGMGTDQGKTSNLNALAALSETRNLPIPELGVTTFRPPYTPLTMGSIVGHDCGDLFHQKRKTPMHPWHDQAHAVYEDVGDWKRPRYFSLGNEAMHAAVQRECRQVRQTGGLLDASTLGKIDLQ